MYVIVRPSKVCMHTELSENFSNQFPPFLPQIHSYGKDNWNGEGYCIDSKSLRPLGGGGGGRLSPESLPTIDPPLG